MLHNLPPRLHCSNLNSAFDGSFTNFQEYIQATRHKLATIRRGAHVEHSEKVIEFNAPFELRPKNPTNKGILFIHGLTDSAYAMRDFARYFCDQGYLVRAILLPGHGSIPGDLLKVREEEWYKSVEFGIDSFSNEVEHLTLFGFSTGASLALKAAVKYTNIEALILICPAFKINTAFDFLTGWHPLFNWLHPQFNWVTLADDHNPLRYESLAWNAGHQVYRLTKEIRRLINKQPFSPPIYMILAGHDHTVRSQNSIDFFLQTKNPLNKLDLYSDDPMSFSDQRIQLLPCKYPEENIVDFSHVSLLHSSRNEYYGKTGSFHDCVYYKKKSALKKESLLNPVLGEITAKNLMLHPGLHRLFYNPDFDNLCGRIDEFLRRVEEIATSLRSSQ